MATKQASKNPFVRLINVWRRLYRGDTNFDFVGKRKWLYLSAGIVTAAITATVFVFPFNLGIEFVGGNQFQAPYVQGQSLTDVEDAVAETGAEISSTQMAGSDNAQRYIIRTPDLDDNETAAVQETLAERLDMPVDDVTVSEVSASWGESVSQQALIALAVFLILVCAYLWFRYDRAMSGASIIGLLQNLVFTAGIYALVGFEVTPNTVIGLLTILGYSLYDNVVVFDKIHENTRDVLKQRRITYGEGANKAINQTLMRSLNTSIIGLLPVAGLLFVGAWVLGVGTLTDLSLVLFVGMAVSTASSLFISSPLVVDITMLNAPYKKHTQKVLEKRANGDVDDDDDDLDGDTGAGQVSLVTDTEFDDIDVEEDAEDAETVGAAASSRSRSASGPRPGARTSGSKKKKKRR